MLLTKCYLKRLPAYFCLAAVVISDMVIIPYINILKPYISAGDKWSYLINVFEEADTWKWINENTPLDARIATYDIRTYYLERDVMMLDGHEATPLYNMTSIVDCLEYLKERNVGYILSIPWAAPLDHRMPPAYKWL